MGGLLNHFKDNAVKAAGMAAMAPLGPAGMAVGAGLADFGKTALSGGNFMESLGAGASGGLNAALGGMGAPGAGEAAGAVTPSMSSMFKGAGFAPNMLTGNNFLTGNMSALPPPGDLQYNAPQASLMDTLMSRSNKY